MEGRLLPPETGSIQSFPRRRWADEFALASLVPFSFIEIIFDFSSAHSHPLFLQPELLRRLSRDSTVEIPAICADYFMGKPFLRCTPSESDARRQVLDQLLQQAGQVGVKRVVLPFVDDSRIQNAREEDGVVEIIEGAVARAHESDVELHLETNLEPLRLASLLDRLPDPMVKVAYDSGNSASLDFDSAEEFAAYGPRIGSVHIKDRVCGGGTVPLGSGNADFRAIFEGLQKIGYHGDLTLQAARGDLGEEMNWAKKNRSFIERLLARNRDSVASAR